MQMHPVNPSRHLDSCLKKGVQIDSSTHREQGGRWQKTEVFFGDNRFGCASSRVCPNKLPKLLLELQIVVEIVLALLIAVLLLQ